MCARGHGAGSRVQFSSGLAGAPARCGRGYRCTLISPAVTPLFPQKILECAFPPTPLISKGYSRNSCQGQSAGRHRRGCPHHTQCTHSALNAQSLVRTQCRVPSCSSCTQCEVHKSAQKASVHSVLSAFGGPCFKRSAQCTKADQRSGRANKSFKLENLG